MPRPSRLRGPCADLRIAKAIAALLLTPRMGQAVARRLIAPLPPHLAVFGVFTVFQKGEVMTNEPTPERSEGKPLPKTSLRQPVAQQGKQPPVDAKRKPATIVPQSDESDEDLFNDLPV